jgi:hypothetical protein
VIAFVCGWCAVLRIYPQTALQIADALWHLAFDGSPRLYWSMHPTLRGLAGMSLIATAGVMQWRRRPNALPWFVAGWALCGSSLVTSIILGHAVMSHPIQTTIQAAWVIPIVCDLLPTIVMSLPAMALGVLAAGDLKCRRWLIAAWSAIQVNLAVLLLLGLAWANLDGMWSKPRPVRSVINHSHQLFTPTPPLEEYYGEDA